MQLTVDPTLTLRGAWPSLAVLTLSLLGPLRAQQPIDQDAARKWASVAEWIGIWEAAETKSTTSTAKGNGSIYLRSGAERRSSGQFRLRRCRPEQGGSWDPDRGIFGWEGAGEERHFVAETRSERDGPDKGADSMVLGGGRRDTKRVAFTVFLGEGHAGYGNGYAETTLPGDFQRTLYYVENGTAMSRTVQGQEGLAVLAPLRVSLTTNGARLRLPATPSVIDYHDVDPHTYTVDNITTQGNTDDLYESRLVLSPVYEDIECEVTIDGYDDWLPAGRIDDPKQPGNAFVARAVLKSKSGKQDLPAVDRFVFQLLDTSREPGICLNYPLGAKDDDYDLRIADFTAAASREASLAAARKFLFEWNASSAGDRDYESLPGGPLPTFSLATVTDNGQRAELSEPPKDQVGRPFAEVAIECFDFGAKSELRVVCMLADGREVLGLMRSPGGEQDIVRLPRRMGPDWVAEKWRDEHEARELAANDDDEAIAGQPLNGDGYALYEEYRGWIVNGKHRQGDPKRKDFFVLNQRGADFRGGIALFARLSRLRVHSTLRDGREMSAGERCMNRNHRAAPHRVDQHGVVLAKDAGLAGGSTVGIDGVDESRAFRPRYVKNVYLEGSEAGRGDQLFAVGAGKNEFNLPQPDAERAWDRAVAHELLHTVGVDHHGEALRRKVDCYFQSAAAPLNTSGKPRYVSRSSQNPEFYLEDGSHPLGEQWREDRGPTIVLQWEDTRRDVFEDFLPEYARRRQFYGSNTASEATQRYLAEVAAKLARLGKSAEWWGRYIDEEAAGNGATRLIWVGPEHGTDSGDDLCVMKYYFANAYRRNGADNAYYLIRPGAARAGCEICRSPAGTLGNAPDHQPQSRFGAASGGRGNCFGQICPNDAIPPRDKTEGGK